MESERRTIFHVDVNSAFLSWSALKRLEEDPDAVDLRTIPSGVGGDVKTRHGIITAKSIPAKKYGVQTGEPVVKALQKCPQLVLVPPDFETYRKYSHALMEILSRYSPLLQQVSIDEAYLDVTERVSEKGTSGVVCPQVGCKETSGVIYTQETSGVVCTSGERERAAALAQQIRDQVRTELGFTVNVGISCNKLLAKMASDFEKPDRTHTLYPEEVPAKMWPLPIEALHGCGKSTAQKLQLIGINTIGDAASADRALLQSFLGQSSGAYIWNSANGISKSKVVAEREQAKSVSNERTLSEDISRENYQADGVPVICMLAQKVAGRLQKSGLGGGFNGIEGFGAIQGNQLLHIVRLLIDARENQRPGADPGAAADPLLSGGADLEGVGQGGQGPDEKRVGLYGIDQTDPVPQTGTDQAHTGLQLVCRKHVGRRLDGSKITFLHIIPPGPRARPCRSFHFCSAGEPPAG